MAEDPLFPVSQDWADRAWANSNKYQEMYDRSVDDPDGFWGEHGKRLDWITPYTKVKNTDFTGDVSIRWYEDGALNAAANCLDRHLESRGDQAAIIWEGDDPDESRTLTYKELHEEVCRLANGIWRWPLPTCVRVQCMQVVQAVGVATPAWGALDGAAPPRPGGTRPPMSAECALRVMLDGRGALPRLPLAVCSRLPMGFVEGRR